MRDSTVVDFKHRLLLLNKPEAAFPEKIKKLMKDNSGEIELKEHEVKLDYPLLDYYQVMRQMLPETIEVPQPLERLGHITCFYLTEEQSSYAKIIGEVWLDKHSDTKTILNRRYVPEEKKITTEYILGEKNTKLKIKETNNFEIILDYLLSNYTTRMEDEHKRILHCINMNYTICDLVADCGDVTIKAAKKGCKVISNCENPGIFPYLQQNITANLNKDNQKVTIYNKKTEDFIKEIMSPKVSGIEEFTKVNIIYISDYFMGLTYIKQIVKAIKTQCEDLLSEVWTLNTLPKIYFYYIAAESLNKTAATEVIRKVFTEVGCPSDCFAEKHLIGLKENNYVYPGLHLHCILIRIPIAAVFGKEYLDMYGGQNQVITDPSSIYSLSIGNTLEIMNDMKIPIISGKRTITELPSENDPKSEKKKKHDNS